jgi:hypothetical protein
MWMVLEHEQPHLARRSMLRDLLRLDGFAIGRKHIATLMRTMGIEALYRKANTSQRYPEHRIYPYLLRGRSPATVITREGQIVAGRNVECESIPLIPFTRRFAAAKVAPPPSRPFRRFLLAHCLGSRDSR